MFTKVIAVEQMTETGMSPYPCTIFKGSFS